MAKSTIMNNAATAVNFNLNGFATVERKAAAGAVELNQEFDNELVKLFVDFANGESLVAPLGFPRDLNKKMYCINLMLGAQLNIKGMDAKSIMKYGENHARTSKDGKVYKMYPFCTKAQAWYAGFTTKLYNAEGEEVGEASPITKMAMLKNIAKEGETPVYINTLEDIYFVGHLTQVK